MFKVDVFVVGADELLSSEMSRKQRIRVREEPPGDLFVASPEDMVLQKLIWYRDGGMVSDRQWGDIIGVIETQGARLDLASFDCGRRAKSLPPLRPCPRRSRDRRRGLKLAVEAHVPERPEQTQDPDE
jgi:hypothetical protein